MLYSGEIGVISFRRPYCHTASRWHVFSQCKTSPLDIIAMQSCNAQILFVYSNWGGSFRSPRGLLREKKKEEAKRRGTELTDKTSNATNGISIRFNLLESLRPARSCNMLLPWPTWSASFMLQMPLTSVIQHAQDNLQLCQQPHTAPGNENRGSASDSSCVVVHFSSSTCFACLWL